MAAFAPAAYGAWVRRGRRWHDTRTILLLLPALGGAVWATAEGALAPGIGLVGLVAALLGYQGRHRD